MIKNYEEKLMETQSKLNARISAAHVRMLARHAKGIEREIRKRQPGYTLRWRDVTTGLVLGFFEHQGMKYDNTYYYLNDLSSHIIDFFEYLREEHGYDKANPAIEAQRILFDPRELHFIRWNAAESYKLYDQALREAGNVKASTFRPAPRTEDMKTTELCARTPKAKKTRPRKQDAKTADLFEQAPKAKKTRTRKAA